MDGGGGGHGPSPWSGHLGRGGADKARIGAGGVGGVGALDSGAAGEAADDTIERRDGGATFALSVLRNDVVRGNARNSYRGHGVSHEGDSREALRGVPGCPPLVPPEGGCCRSVCPMYGHDSSPSRRLVG